MDLQDVEWIGSTGDTLSKMSRIVTKQANEILRLQGDLEKLTSENGRLVNAIMENENAERKSEISAVSKQA